MIDATYHTRAGLRDPSPYERAEAVARLREQWADEHRTPAIAAATVEAIIDAADWSAHDDAEPVRAAMRTALLKLTEGGERIAAYYAAHGLAHVGRERIPEGPLWGVLPEIAAAYNVIPNFDPWREGER